MNPGQRIHLGGPLWLLVGQREGRFPCCHGVLIKDGNTTALLDPGCGPRVLEPLAAGGEVDLVINSHTHPDHTAGNHFFAGKELLVPEAAWDTAGDLVKLSERLAEPGPLAAQWRHYAVQVMGLAPYRASGSFAPGERLKIGSTELVVIATPGHSADHCCFWLPESRTLLSADIDLTPFGPFYGNRESSLAQMRRDITTVLDLNPRLLVSSHREPISQGIASACQDFARTMDARSERILELLGQEMTREQLVDISPIYGGRPHQALLTRFWEGQMIDQHLAELLDQGRVRATDLGYLAV